LLQVSGDGNNHVVPYTMAHQKGHEDWLQSYLPPLWHTVLPERDSYILYGNSQSCTICMAAKSP
jgi:hypothetical protein